MSKSSLQRFLRRTETWVRLLFRAGQVGRFLGYTGARFLADGCPRQAAGLSYVSLLAIVPLLAIGMAIFAGFPTFATMRADVQGLILRNMLPDMESQVSDQLTAFIENASNMTGPGLVGLGVTAILLLSNINGALNAIWRVAEPRPFVMRVMVYWMLLTLGPLLIGASLSVSSYAFAAVQWLDVAQVTELRIFSRLVATVLAMLGFGLIYFVVPNRSIHPGHALAGGLVAAVLLETLKAGFGLYLRHFPSYQLVYGAVSTIPIFLVWMYLSWAVILLGAETAAALPEWRAARARGRRKAGPGASLALGLSLMLRLWQASRTGTRLRERELGRGLPATPSEVDATLRALRRAGYIARTLSGRWVLGRDVATITLNDLAELQGLDPAPGEGWPPAAQAAADAVTAAGQAEMSKTLVDLFAVEEESRRG
ncbi:MAG: YihY family inner membrane protein [Alphaproteobacteria bacterium]